MSIPQEKQKDRVSRPRAYTAAVCSRRQDDKGKVTISRKSVSIFKKLCKVISSYSFVDII